MSSTRRSFLGFLSVIATGLLARVPGTKVSTPRAPEDGPQFHKDTITALQLANQEAQRFCHDELGTGHVVIGLYRFWESFDPEVSQTVGYSFADLREAMMQLVGMGDQEVLMGKLGKSHELIDCIDVAIEMARKQGDDWIYTEHLMEAVRANPDSVGTKIVWQALRNNGNVRSPYVSI